MSDPAPAPELYVELGVVDPDKLQMCLKQQATLLSQGKEADFGDVLLRMRAAKPDQVARVRAHGGAGKLRCPNCRRRYTVPDYQANRRYKCAPCLAYLEIVVEEELEQIPAPSGSPAAAGRGAGKRDPFEGRLFGRYRVLGKIAKGGMGAVYLGEHVEKRSKVALKILTEEFSRMPGIQGRFKREGNAAARLEHPNIVSTIEMGREGNYTYIASEYVDGGSLVDLIVREKRLPPERAVKITCDVLHGLQHAHERGVIHRDIKPGNVLMTSEGKAKLIDFGLASDAEAQTILTLTGNVVGTPSFMSPEQAMGEKAGPASDQYASGILAWLMLVGKKPFEGKGLVQVLQKQIKEPLPSLVPLLPGIPPALDKTIQKMTSKQPEQRYPSPAAAAGALKRSVGLAPGPAEAEGMAAVGGGTGVPWYWLALAILAAAAASAATTVWIVG